MERRAIISLGLALVLLFGTAFSCGQNNNGRRVSVENDRENDRNESAGALTKEIVEQEVRAREERPASSLHEARTVQVDSVDLETPHPWERGDIVGGKPGDTVYPARVHFTRRELFTDSTHVWEMNWVYDCLKNDEGKWNCEPGPELPRTQERRPDEPAANP